MRCVVRISAALQDQVFPRLLGSRWERFCYLLARGSRYEDPWGGPTVDLRVFTAVPVPAESLAVQSEVRVEVDPAFTRSVLMTCHNLGLSLVDVHTHPFSNGSVAFSGIDTANMLETHTEFYASIPQDPPALAASLVLGQTSIAGMWWDPESGRLAPIDRMLRVGRPLEEVPLCR